MKYAVIQLGGKQFMVSEGDVFKVERQGDLNINVLLLSDGGKILVGTPYLKDVAVKAKVVEDKLDDKVTVARYRAKSRYRKKKGHRQPVSIIEIESIGKKTGKKAEPAKKSAEKAAPKTVKAKTTRKASAKKTPAKKSEKVEKKGEK